MLVLLAVAVLVIFAIGLGYYVLNGRLDSKQEELADVQQQTSQLESQVAALDRFAQLSSQRQNAEANVRQIYAGRTLVASILDTISFVVPEDAWFSTLTLETADPVGKAPGGAGAPSSPGQAQTTMAVEGNTYSFEGVAQVLIRLKLVPQLTDVELLSAGEPSGATDPAKDVKGFSITAAVMNDQPEDTPLPLSQVEVATP
jgi:Tfp pilus assembly protein PilN